MSSAPGTRRASQVAFLAGLVAAVLVLPSACGVSYRWKAQPVTEADLRQTTLRSRHVRMQLEDGVIMLRADSLSFPYLFGRVVPPSGSDRRDTLSPLVAVPMHEPLSIFLGRTIPGRVPQATELVARTLGDGRIEGDTTRLAAPALVIDGKSGTVILTDTRQVETGVIEQFIDAHAFDVRSVKKSCIHIVHPDGRLIPFDTYNIFYRDDLETTRLAPLRDATGWTTATPLRRRGPVAAV